MSDTGLRVLLLQKRLCIFLSHSSIKLFRACEAGDLSAAEALLLSAEDITVSADILNVATRHGHRDCVELLLKNGADVNCTDGRGLSPLAVACESKHYAIVLSLIEHGAELNDSLLNGRLHGTVGSSDMPFVQKILERGAVRLLSTDMIVAAFRCAFESGSYDLASQMLYSNNDVDFHEHYPYAVYFCAKYNWYDILLKLLEKGADVNLRTKFRTPLYVACEEGHCDMVELLLKHGADPNLTNYTTVNDIFLLRLQIGSYHGHVAIVDHLVRSGANIHPSCCTAKKPPLHFACSSFSYTSAECPMSIYSSLTKPTMNNSDLKAATVRKLLELGASVNAVCAEGTTALYDACAYQLVDIVQVLLEAGADANLTTTDAYPLIAACLTGNFRIVELLIAAGASVCCTNKSQETCLHVLFASALKTLKSNIVAPDNKVLVWKPDRTAIVKILLKNLIDVDACCSQGQTALYKATICHLADIVQLLLEFGATVCATSECSPFIAACELGSKQIVEMLVLHGADVNVCYSKNAASANNFTTPLAVTVMKGFVDVVQLLLNSNVDVNQRVSGKTVVMLLVEAMTSDVECRDASLLSLYDTRPKILKMLLEAGADVNIPSLSDGNTALQIASCAGLTDVVRAFIQHGADCNQLANTQCCLSPLETAVAKNHVKVVEELLKGGANPDRLPSGLPLSIACQNNYTEIAELLLSHGAKPNANMVYCVKPVADSNSNIFIVHSRSVLCIACMHGNSELAASLLHRGALVNAADNQGETALHYAIKSIPQKDIQDADRVVAVLLQYGVNVDDVSKHGETPLALACRRSMSSIVKLLLDHGADVHLLTSCSYPLLEACKQRLSPVVDLLLARGANPNICDGTLTPLKIAAANGDVAMVQTLLRYGVNVNQMEQMSDTALHAAVSTAVKSSSADQQAEFITVISILLQNGAKPNVLNRNGETPLYVLCASSDINCDVILNLLLENGADPNLIPPMLNKAMRKQYSGKSPLCCAAEKGHDSLAAALLTSKSDIDINYRDLHGKTALLYALEATQHETQSAAAVKLVEMLLIHRASTNVTDNKGNSPLYLSCNGSVATSYLSKLLLSYGASPNTLFPDLSSSTNTPPKSAVSPLSFTVQKRKTELVGLLVKSGAALNHQDDSGETALHHALKVFHIYMNPAIGWTTTIELLARSGSDVNITDSDGKTPLYTACQKGSYDLVRMLLSYGADPNVGANDNYPLAAACQDCRNNEQMIELLLAAGANPNVRCPSTTFVNNYSPPLCLAVQQENLNISEKLLQYGASVNVCDSNSKTALHIAAQFELNSSFIDLLLENGADTNLVDGNKETPLYMACCIERVDIVEKMLSFGAETNSNSVWKRPLNAACSLDNEVLVELLLANGADPNKSEAELHDSLHCLTSSLPLHTAADHCNSEIVTTLLSHGADIDMCDLKGSTALHLAVSSFAYPGENGPTERELQCMCVVQLLLDNGADTNLKNRDARTPLFIACQSGHKDMVSAMLLCGADPNVTSKTECLLCAVFKRFEILELLLRSGANSSGQYCTVCGPPLCKVIKVSGSVDMIRLLLDCGADVNMHNKSGFNALHLAVKRAVRFRYIDGAPMSTFYKAGTSLVRLLLERGADVNKLTNTTGRSALFKLLCAFGRESYGCRRFLIIELIKLLVEHGASLNDCDANIDPDCCDLTLSLLIAHKDGVYKFIMDLFKAGAGFQILMWCCKSVLSQYAVLLRPATHHLAQAAILAGYTPDYVELLQLEAPENPRYNDASAELQTWLIADRQLPPSLMRQCRIVIRKQLSVCNSYKTILPAVETLPLPKDLRLYLRYEGCLSEVDLTLPTDQTSVFKFYHRSFSERFEDSDGEVSDGFEEHFNPSEADDASDSADDGDSADVDESDDDSDDFLSICSII